MKIYLTRLVLASAGTIVLSSVANLKPAQAGNFEFYFAYNPSNNEYGSGYLSFTDSNLTGVGYESAKLSDLPANTQFDIGYGIFIQISPWGQSVSLNTSNFSEPTFYFDSGYLIGIQTKGSASFSDGTGGGDSAGLVEGNVVVSAQGNAYTSNLIGQQELYQIVYDENGDLEGFELESSSPYRLDLSSGYIDFYTNQLIESKTIPEPLTILGTGAAISFAAAFKRRLKKKPDNN